MFQAKDMLDLPLMDCIHVWRMLAVDNQAKMVSCQGFPLELYMLGRVTQAFWTCPPWKDQNWQKWQTRVSQKKTTWHLLLLQPTSDFFVGSASPRGWNIHTICKNMTITEKIVQSYLDYISTPNVHFVLFSPLLRYTLMPDIEKYDEQTMPCCQFLFCIPIFQHRFWIFVFLPQLKTNSLTGKCKFNCNLCWIKKKTRNIHFLSILIQMRTIRLISQLS